jgi:hypothetical protein
MTEYEINCTDDYGSSLSYEDRYINHAPDLLETHARKRRLNLFKSLTGFREVRAKPSFFDRIPRGYWDHTSFWSDGSRRYVLCEPYNPELPIGPVGGLAVIILPIEISPYCGGWSADPTSKPGSKSLLFTSSENVCTLKSIHLMMIGASRIAPRWNALELE